MNDLNKDIKIFFIDLDGTLLDKRGKHTHGISEENINALTAAKKNGKIIVISTGRTGLQAKKYLDKIDHTYAVTGNGSIILNNGKIEKEIFMSLRQSLLILDFVKKHGLVLKIDDSRIGYGSFKFLQTLVTKKMNFEPVKNFNYELHKQYHKIVIWGKSRKKMEEIRVIIKSEIKGLSVVSSSKGWTLEISHESATKGFGNLYVASKFGIINKKEMAHIGDSMNDSTVIGHMRLIAMKNSVKELYSMTNYIGPSYKYGGVAKILKGEYKIK